MCEDAIFAASGTVFALNRITGFAAAAGHLEEIAPARDALEIHQHPLDLRLAEVVLEKIGFVYVDLVADRRRQGEPLALAPGKVEQPHGDAAALGDQPHRPRAHDPLLRREVQNHVLVGVHGSDAVGAYDADAVLPGDGRGFLRQLPAFRVELVEAAGLDDYPS